MTERHAHQFEVRPSHQPTVAEVVPDGQLVLTEARLEGGDVLVLDVENDGDGLHRPSLFLRDPAMGATIEPMPTHVRSRPALRLIAATVLAVVAFAGVSA